MRQVSVICSFGIQKDVRNMKPLYFGDTNSSGKSKSTKIEYVLQAVDGRTVNYVNFTNRYVFDCGFTVNDREVVVRLVSDPKMLTWCIDD